MELEGKIILEMKRKMEETAANNITEHALREIEDKMQINF